MKQFVLKVPCNSLNVHAILDCIIHSILFQRLMIPVQPRDQQLMLDDATLHWVKIGNQVIHTTVKAKIEEIVKAGHRQCAIRFYYKVAQSWFLSKQQFYESWMIQLHYTDTDYATEVDDLLQQILNNSLHGIPKLGKDKEVGYEIQFLNNWSQGLLGKWLDAQPSLLS